MVSSSAPRCTSRRIQEGLTVGLKRAGASVREYKGLQASNSMAFLVESWY